MKPIHKVQNEAEFVREHVRGDVRADGKVFESYRYMKGKVYERWCSPAELTERCAMSNKMSRAWAMRPENKPKMSKWSSESQKRRRQADPAALMLVSARGRAKEKGIPFNIVSADIPVPEVCPVLGLKLVIGVGACSDSSPSIDRIIPSLGYVKGNVRVISRRANRIKNDATPDELYKVWKYASEQF